MDKIALRQRVLKIRKDLSPEVRAEKSAVILAKLEALAAFQKAEHVLFYHTHRDEVDTLPLLRKTLNIKHLYLPVMKDDETLEAVPVTDLSTLVKNEWGILEPLCPESCVLCPPPDLIIVPGVAFDQMGHRLGTGKGYYDRFLKRYPEAYKVGLAFSEQMLDLVPQEPYDVGVDLVLTDQQSTQD